MTLLPDLNRTPPFAPWGIPATLAWLVFSFLVGALVATAFFAAFQIDAARASEHRL